MNALRKDIEHDIITLLDDMDPSGKNTKRMTDFLGQMDDKTFFKFIDEFFDNENKLVPVGYEAYNNPVTLRFAHNVAKKHNVPIYEYVYRPYASDDPEDWKDPPGTVNKIMVIDVPVKRLKQMAQSKNHVSTASSKRDPRTGQVSGEDKTARITDVETYAALAMGQYNAVQEAFGPMADDLAAHEEMLRQIQRNGEVELADLPNDPLDKVTINSINALLTGACIRTNLVDATGLMLPITMKGREDHATTIDRG